MGTGAAEVLEGGCHCGAVRYRVTVHQRKGVVCNCSICAMKGFLHLIVDEADFELLRGQDALTTYTFGTHVAKHHFCGTCGIHSFYLPRSHPEKVDVTLATVPTGIPIFVDGVSQAVPTDYDTLIGFQHEIAAPVSYCLNGQNYLFDNWSNGGAATQIRCHA